MVLGSVTVKSVVWTVGDRGWSRERLMELLTQEQFELVVDVRARANGAGAPELDYDALRPSVTALGIRYAYMGDLFDVMGEREPEPERVVMGATRVAEGARRWRVLVFGGEEDPVGTTRREVVAWALVQLGCSVKHVRAGGRVEDELGFDAEA
jgi:uncharacterized protein (DUF488 family)